MSNVKLEITHFTPARLKGSSPAYDQDYVLVVFDISNQKKYRILVKILRKYGTAIQKSVYAAHINRSQFATLMKELERLTGSEKYFDANDSVYVYKIAGNCEATAFGVYTKTALDENIIL